MYIVNLQSCTTIEDFDEGFVFTSCQRRQIKFVDKIKVKHAY